MSRILASATVFALAVSFAQAQNTVTLRYNLKKGQKYIYRTKQTMKQTQKVQQQTIKTNITSTEIGVWTLEKVDKKGNLELRTENKLLQTNVEIGPLGKYVYDSKKEENDSASQLGASLTPLYDRLKGAVMRITLTPQGELKELKGYKELIGDVLKDNPIAAQFAGGGSEKAAKINFSEYFPHLSKKPVQVGDQWEAPFDLTLAKFGKATGKRIYTYDGPGKVGKTKTAKITVAMELSFDLKLDQGGAKVTGNLSVTDSSGTIHFDPKNGHVVSIATSYSIGGNLNVAVGGKDIPVESEQTHRITRVLLSKLP